MEKSSRWRRVAARLEMSLKWSEWLRSRPVGEVVLWTLLYRFVWARSMADATRRSLIADWLVYWLD